MDRYAATLELMTPDEVEHALHFVGVMHRAGHMDAEEAGTRRPDCSQVTGESTREGDAC